MKQAIIALTLSLLFISTGECTPHPLPTNISVKIEYIDAQGKHQTRKGLLTDYSADTLTVLHNNQYFRLASHVILTAVFLTDGNIIQVFAPFFYGLDTSEEFEGALEDFNKVLNTLADLEKFVNTEKPSQAIQTDTYPQNHTKPNIPATKPAYAKNKNSKRHSESFVFSNPFTSSKKFSFKLW